MRHIHSPLSKSTEERKSSPRTDLQGRQYVLIDLTTPVRHFINTVDYEVNDLGYDVAGIIEYYNSTDYQTPENLVSISRMSEIFMSRGFTKDFDDALTVADYTLNILYPAILKILNNLGFHGGLVVKGNLDLTGKNRKIYCTAVFMVV